MEVGSSSLPGTTPVAGGLAQLARAPALQAGGQRFESVILHSPVLSVRTVPGGMLDRDTFYDMLETNDSPAARPVYGED